MLPGGTNSAYLNFEDIGQSIQSLNTHFTEFNRIGKPNQQLLIETSANLEKLGLNTETFAQNLNLANKSLGYSIPEYVEWQKELFGASKALGISVDTLNRGFQKMGAKYGTGQAKKVFLDLALASKNLGIEMDRLLDITENFTTFEGAAEAAGRFNAILGRKCPCYIRSLECFNR